MKHSLFISFLLISINSYSHFENIKEILVAIVHGYIDAPIYFKIKDQSTDITLQECIDYAAILYPYLNTWNNQNSVIVSTGRILKAKDLKMRLVNIEGLIQPVSDNDFKNGQGYINIHFMP